jgi:hypothetical protein
MSGYLRVFFKQEPRPDQFRNVAQAFGRSEEEVIELLDVAGIPVARRYEYRGEGNKVAVVLEFKNDEKVAGGLGVPLPKGPVRIFQRDADNEVEFAGMDNLDHTPRRELVKIRHGYAFDLSGERRQVGFRAGVNQNEADMEIRLRNHKTEPVRIDAVEPINGQMNWTMVKQSHPFTPRDVNTLVFPVEVKPNSEAVITYTIRYTW